MHENVEIDRFNKCLIRNDIQKSDETILQLFFLGPIAFGADFNLVRQTSEESLELIIMPKT